MEMAEKAESNFIRRYRQMGRVEYDEMISVENR